LEERNQFFGRAHDNRLSSLKSAMNSQTHGHGGPHKHGKTFSIAQANNTKNSDAKTKPHPLLPSQSIIQVIRINSPWMAEPKSNAAVTFADAMNGFVLSVRDSFVFLNCTSFTREFSYIKQQVFDNGVLQSSVITMITKPS
jgi:hypothetical protein